MLKLVFLSKYRKYIKPLTWRRSLAGRGKTLFLPTWYHNTVRLKIYVDPMLRAWVFLYFLGMLWANILSCVYHTIHFQDYPWPSLLKPALCGLTMREDKSRKIWVSEGSRGWMYWTLNQKLMLSFQLIEKLEY